MLTVFCVSRPGRSVSRRRTGRTGRVPRQSRVGVAQGILRSSELEKANRAVAKHQDGKATKTPTHQKSYQLFQEKLSPAQIAYKRGITENTVYTHLIKINELGTPLDLHQFIKSTEILKIQQAKKELDNPDSLKAYFEYFEQKIPYHKIKLGLYLKK